MSYKILFAIEDFFRYPKRVAIEDAPFTGRVYFLLKDQIVAVAVKT